MGELREVGSGATSHEIAAASPRDLGTGNYGLDSETIHSYIATTVHSRLLCEMELPMRNEAMPTIRISDTSWERLKTWAEPLVDTADSALEKALDAAERSRGRTPKPRKPPVPPKLGLSAVGPSHDGTPRSQEPAVPSRPGLSAAKLAKLPQKEFRKPLLQAIHELGGSAQVHELRPILRDRMKSRLLPGDFEHVSGGVERWWNAACWVRHDLVNEGYFRSDSPRGIWALSDEGVKLVENLLKESSGDFADHLRAMPDVGEDSDFDR